MENAIEKILSRIDTNNLPVLPKILVELLDAIHQQNISFDSLAKIIAQDASISANIMAAAHSSYYGQPREVTDLKKMLQVIGLDKVKTLVMIRAIQQFFARIPLAQQHHLEIIWYQSLTCAHLARNLAQLTAYEFPDEVYLAGLVHRLGQLLLIQCFPNEYPDFLKDHPDGDVALEKAQFGAAHHEVAAYLITSWNLQSFIADAVLCQYEPVESILDSAIIVKILNLASNLSRMDLENKYFIFGQANRLFGLNQSLVDSMLHDVGQLVKDSAKSLNINISKSAQNKFENLTTVDQRQDVQALLGESVKNIALSAAIQNPTQPVDELSKLASTLRRDMSILFGLPAASLFIYQQEKRTLDSTESEHIGGILEPICSISIEAENSLLAKAWRTQKLLHSFNRDKTAVESTLDRQVSQFMNTEDMIVFPLIHEEKVLGVLAAGLKRTDVKRIKMNLSFIHLFVGEAAKILHTLQIQTAPPKLTEDSVIQSNYALYAKKIGHEINNPLSIINNYLYLLSLKLGDDHTEKIKIIQEEIERVSNITLSLSDFSLTALQTINTSVDLNALIINLIDLFEAGIFNTPVISTQLKLDNTLLETSINTDKLKQILTNIIKNAVEAMPSGGEIFITTKMSKLFNNKPGIEIQIQDNGPGISDAMMQQLFKPVKSIKGKYNAGLGLAICKNLIDELKGDIRCESIIGKGTTFHIILPIEI